MSKFFSTFFIALLAFSATALAQQPDLGRLSQSGYIMGPGNSSYPIHDGWKKAAAFMRYVDVFDSVVSRVESVVCGTEQNKSVLLIGEPSLAYQYIFARLANRPGSKCPASMWHVDVNVSKIESGNKYVGDVDAYWNNNILNPSDRKDVVLYFQSVGNLVGIGSHMQDDTGIEREYVANFTAGRLRTVGFIDKYEYNEMIRSKHAYVLEAYADRIILPPIDQAQTNVLLRTYLSTLYPQLTLGDKELNYLTRTIAYYQPNRQEPDRSMSVVNELIRRLPNNGESKPVSFAVNVESKHPYDNNSNQTWTIEKPDVSYLQLVFDTFDMENGYDYVEVWNAATNTMLERFTGVQNGLKTQFYPTNKIKLVLKSDKEGQANGFKMTVANGKTVQKVEFTQEDVRRALLSVAQVPSWIVERDYKIIRELPGKLDGDVVGVAEGKKDLVRLAKNGYVAGRTDDKPIATILFTGPTGTGKSYIAKRMADFTGMRLITIDMTTYKESSSFKDFQEIMARHLTNTPYAMYLFEEIDKASIEVLDQLYFMMDEGVFYDKYQRPLFARGAFIMMTTNAASDTILKDPNHPELRSLVMGDLKKAFRASFLNRFDAISIFKPFTDPEFQQLAKTLVDKKILNTKDLFDWTITVDQGLYSYIAQYGRSPEFGARPMERLVEGTLGIGIAEYQLNYGAMPADANIAITKMAPTHRFKIVVNNNKANEVQYDVDPQNNLQFFQYKDRLNHKFFNRFLTKKLYLK